MLSYIIPSFCTHITTHIFKWWAVPVCLNQSVQNMDLCLLVYCQYFSATPHYLMIWFHKHRGLRLDTKMERKWYPFIPLFKEFKCAICTPWRQKFIKWIITNRYFLRHLSKYYFEAKALWGNSCSRRSRRRWFQHGIHVTDIKKLIE